MATQYTDILKLALPVQGELTGTWGDTINDGITTLVEQAIAGRVVVDTWQPGAPGQDPQNKHVLSVAEGTASESRAAILKLTDTGVTLTDAGTLICPLASKVYIVQNSTAQTITVKTVTGTGISIEVGVTKTVFCDATNVLDPVGYNNASSGLTATSVQSAIDEVEARVETAESNIATNTSNIATNTSNIATNTSNIAANTSNVATNTSNIATNTGVIAGLGTASTYDVGTGAGQLPTTGDADSRYLSLTGGTVTGDVILVNSGFKIYNDVGNANPNFYKAHDAGGGMGMGQNRARGTIAAPTALVDGDIVSGISALGHDGTAYKASGGFRFKVAGTVSTGVVPMKLVLETSETSSVVERLVVMPDGKIGIGTAAPTTELDVVGTIQGDGLIVQTTQGNISINNGVSGLDFARAGSSYIRATDAAGSLNIVTGANNFASVRLVISPTGVVTNPNSSATNTDTTAHRVLKVGDFGLGVTSSPEYPKTDISDVTCPSGMYRLTNVNPSAGTRPAGHSAYGYIQVLSYASSEKFQIAADINGKVASRSLKPSGNTDWVDHYTSGNSINPLDYGLGGQAVLTNDFDTITSTGFYRNSSGSAVGAPFGGSLFAISHVQSSANAATQTAVDAYATTTAERCFTRSKGSSGWQPWVETFHSGNSVNPLDYGLGIDGTTSAPTVGNFNTLSNSGLFRQSGGEQGQPFQSSIGTMLNLRRSSNYGVSQLYLRGNEADDGVQVYARGGNVSGTPSFTSWKEFYHSGNTNFNKVGGDGVFANDYLVRGYAYSATGAVFFVPLNNVDTMPSSLTVLANSAFKVTNALGTSTGTVPSAATYPQITFDPLSTQRQLVFIITGLSGMTVGEPLNLRATATSSGFTYA